MTAIIRSRRTTTIAIIKPREDADAKDIKKNSKNHKIISETKNKGKQYNFTLYHFKNGMLPGSSVVNGHVTANE